MAKNDNKSEGKAVNLRERVSITAIKRDGGKQHMAPGKEYKVTPLVASNLVGTGHAKYTDDKEQKAWEAANKTKSKKGSEEPTE